MTVSGIVSQATVEAIPFELKNAKQYEKAFNIFPTRTLSCRPGMFGG